MRAAQNAGRPLVVGIGGTLRPLSSSERALRVALAAAQAAGADIEIVTGNGLLVPIYDPGVAERTPEVIRLIELVRRSEGLIIASPGYHGSLSGMIKNAIDFVEDLREEPEPYFGGRAVGCVASAAGWQAAGSTLAALRSIVHALRGWPTPLGVCLNSTMPVFDATGRCTDVGVSGQLEMLGQQVVEFAKMRRALVASRA